MSLKFDQKEDLRFRMAELEKKLMESEEERCKLEKTCNVLMKAFREEEKMQYKALNKKYEKFLDDCALRKKRNDIILKSLARIEDRSRALFAKTERLKLLKDRYISYLKINDLKKNEGTFQPGRNFPLAHSVQGFAVEVPSSRKWETPLDTFKRVELKEERGGESFEKYKSPALIYGHCPDGNVDEWRRDKSQGREDQENTREREAVNGMVNRRELSESSRAQNKSDPAGTSWDSSDPRSVSAGEQHKNEKLGSDRIKRSKSVELEKHISNDKLEVKDLAEITSLREKKAESQYESVGKLKRDFSFEDDHFSWGRRNESPSRKDGGEEQKGNPISEQNRSIPASYHNINNNMIAREFDEEKGKKISGHEEWRVEEDFAREQNIPSEALPNNRKSLPMGLDGVDYQNETYPESYYEQPVHHHNHTSLASDVILEEDETEQDVEGSKELVFEESSQEGTGPNPGPVKDASHEPGGSSPGQSARESSRGSGEERGEEKSWQEKSEGRSGLESEEPGRGKTLGKSNLLHLLESDSESFQIEHGDVMSGNEDSDFDFSFGQK